MATAVLAEQVFWSEILVDGEDGWPVSAIRRGQAIVWTGRASRALDEGVPGYRAAGLTPSPRQIGRLVLSDGERLLSARLFQSPLAATPYLCFDTHLPREGRPMVVRDISFGDAGRDRVICFTAGTPIETRAGRIAVEDVRPGDRLWTRDNGYKEVLWAGHRRITGGMLAATPALRPVEVRGPEGDVLVSPRHRVLTASETLVPAAGLTAGARRRLVPGGIVYVHLLLEDHQILRAGGIDSESFHPASMPLTSISPTDRDGLLRLFPQLATGKAGYGPLARPVAETGRLTAH